MFKCIYRTKTTISVRFGPNHIVCNSKGYLDLHFIKTITEVLNKKRKPIRFFRFLAKEWIDFQDF